MRLAAAASAALTAMPATAPAQGPTVYLPAPPKPGPRPAWNCRVQQSVGTTMIHAARQLDAGGAVLMDSAGWTDIFTADEQAPLTVSVSWLPEAGPLRFAEGRATFYFRTRQPMASPLGARIEGQRTMKLEAWQAYDNPRHFVTYAPINKMLDMAGGAGEMRWTLRGRVPGQGGAPIAQDGVYALAELRALAPGIAGVLAQPDAMQADFARRCRRL
ncbi:hypothetical protein QH494_27475 [Sphingomonas sp. AR_OL41]|uniref:hypothetical protein n=1 Tax=Sphingomonas sp. AR_OL41 TaxID=3042729 RepID=UPI00247FCD70|nr:hypothetical protein [Sphingomonas sp. AR_OL41]MDH7975937.1 hypothetical protein [Sphingomonas sp. AR_OL41]